MKRQNGFSILEVLLAMAIMGVLTVALPGALSTANKTTVMSNQHTLAESLARSQMDNIQSQDYDKTNNPPVYTTISSVPDGYVITITSERLDPKNNGLDNDDGLQKITVEVAQNSKSIYTLVDYKLNSNP